MNRQRLFSLLFAVITMAGAAMLTANAAGATEPIACQDLACDTSFGCQAYTGANCNSGGPDHPGFCASSRCK